MTTISTLYMIVNRAFPGHKALQSLTQATNLKAAWNQLAAAAGVDGWAIAHAIAREMGLEVATNLESTESFSVLLIPERLASEHLLLPLFEEAGTLVVACASPFDENGLRRAQFVSDRKLKILVAPPEAIEAAIVNAYSRVTEHQAATIGTLLWTTEGESLRQGPVEENSIVRLARSLLIESIKAGASDIHLQPFTGGGLVRVRVDGILLRLTFIPGPVLEALIRYFKAQGGMDPTNDLMPQDGRMSLVIGRRDFDLRLSVLPASRGERLVIRFLDQSRVYRLSGLGLSTAAQLSLRKLAANSSGVVLVTGPTGSGKTSTLYSMLAEINRIGVSIITVENPVEYRVPGISQVEINPKAGLTFASALRSILRQDPDVILIGEIRDAETAEIAMQAALTGHLVLSTLHTNDALTAIPRLIDLGIQPSILADAIAGIVAQRLFRKLCMACRVPVTEPLLPDERLFFEVMGERPMYRAVGCEACKGAGYRGRQPVTEVVEMTPELGQQLASGHNNLAKLRELATGPLSSLSHGAAMRVISGDTTAGEAARVIGQRFWSDLARMLGRPLRAGAVASLVPEGDTIRAGVGILLFEINSNERDAISAALAKIAIDVHATDSPEAARDIVEKNENIVLAVVDLDASPSGGNIDVLRRLRRALAWSRLATLLIVPESDFALRHVLQEHGVSDYLVKPVTIETIVARVQAVLAR